MEQTITIRATDDEYGKVFRIVEQALNPDRPPLQPDPRAAKAALAIFRTLGIWPTPKR